MNRAELISILSKKTNISKTKCDLLLKQLKKTVLEVCCKGEDISLRDFGKFSLQEKKERKFLNPQTHRYYICPAKKYISFKGFKNFVYSVK